MIFVGVSIASAIVYLILTNIVIEKLENTMYSTMISHEIDELIVDLAENPDTKMPKTASVNAYLLSRDGVKPIPDEIKGLRPDAYNKIKIGNKINEVAILEFNGDKLYVLFDVTEVSKYLSLLFTILIIGGVVSGSLLIIFAVWFFKKHLSPVSNLAVEVALINPNERNVRIGTKFQDYEVGLIAQSIDQFMDRLDEFVEREQSFTAAVSHELRTPIAVISTAVELLELKSVTSGQQTVINRIKKSVKYMHNVIETLLFFARDTHEIVEKTLPEIGLNELFYEVLESYEEQAALKKLELRFKGKSKTKVRAVDNHLEIVLSNLVQNSINNTDQGEVKVTLFESGFLVEDTGKGIEPEEIQYIVKRNYHNPNSSGNGLGLFLVKHICEIYGFKLEIESELGKGSKFAIIFN